MLKENKRLFGFSKKIRGSLTGYNQYSRRRHQDHNRALARVEGDNYLQLLVSHF